LFSLKPTGKQRIHALLRRDPTLSSRQLANAVGSTTAYARIWRRNFFAPEHELEEPDSMGENGTVSTTSTTSTSNTVSPASTANIPQSVGAGAIDPVQEKA
jgi:hypothetical protein